MSTKDFIQRRRMDYEPKENLKLADVTVGQTAAQSVRPGLRLVLSRCFSRHFLRSVLLGFGDSCFSTEFPVALCLSADASLERSLACLASGSQFTAGGGAFGPQCDSSPLSRWAGLPNVQSCLGSLRGTAPPLVTWWGIGLHGRGIR